MSQKSYQFEDEESGKKIKFVLPKRKEENENEELYTFNEEQEKHQTIH